MSLLAPCQADVKSLLQDVYGTGLLQNLTGDLSAVTTYSICLQALASSCGS